MAKDEFEQVRAERDPLRQAQRATELLALYQQRGVELARLRKEAIDRAAQDLGMSYTAVAARIGLSKGRITQIRQTAPPVERAFFGVGPVTVAVPLRRMDGRSAGVIAREDAASAEQLTSLLTSLQLQVQQFHIPTDGEWTPSGDTVAICGPKSSHVTAEAIEADPLLTFGRDDDGRWTLRDKATGQHFHSPMDEGSADEDLAYLGRLPYGDGTLLVIAGIHALGSHGAVEYLASNLPTLYKTLGTQSFSAVVRCKVEDGKVLESEAVWGPRTHA